MAQPRKEITRTVRLCLLILTSMATQTMVMSSGSVNPNWVEKYRMTLEGFNTNDTEKEALDRYMETYNENMEGHTPNEGRDCYEYLLPACDSFSKDREPQNVHELTAADIDVIAAIGDSFTSGSGVLAVDLEGILIENRNRSWITGGESRYDRTIGNFIRFFNPHVYGLSSGMNVASAGSTSKDLHWQAEQLINLMKNDPNIDISQDWKLITIYMGRNDLCWMCQDEENLGIKKYVENLEATLALLSSELPRTFVNVVAPPSLELWLGPDEENVISQKLHDVMCPCYLDALRVHVWQGMLKQHEDLVLNISHSMLHSSRTTDSFTAVYQPCFEDSTLPRRSNGHVDHVYFSPDYYHFNLMGQQVMATSLWNGMFEDVSMKKSSFPYEANPHCPSKLDYLKTRWNSMDDRPVIEQERSSKSWASSGIIVGIIFTVVVFLGAIAIAAFILMAQRAKEKRRESIKPVVFQDQLQMIKDNPAFSAP